MLILRPTGNQIQESLPNPPQHGPSCVSTLVDRTNQPTNQPRDKIPTVESSHQVGRTEPPSLSNSLVMSVCTVRTKT